MGGVAGLYGDQGPESFSFPPRGPEKISSPPSDARIASKRRGARTG